MLFRSRRNVCRDRDIMHVAQSQKRHFVRLVSLCVQGITEEEEHVYLVAGYSCSDLLISADGGKMTVMESDVWHEYRMPSGEVYNLYNALAAVTLLRTMGYPWEEIAGAMEGLKVVESRYQSEEIGRWQLTASMAKGLNAVACSRNFDTVSHAPGKKAVVLLLDDVFDERDSSENTAWLYDADFEFLNEPDIVQVLAVGVRCLDTRLRLLLAGLDRERVIPVPRAADAAALVDLNLCEHVFVLFEVYRHGQAMEVRKAIAERMREA